MTLQPEPRVFRSDPDTVVWRLSYVLCSFAGILMPHLVLALPHLLPPGVGDGARWWGSRERRGSSGPGTRPSGGPASPTCVLPHSAGAMSPLQWVTGSRCQAHVNCAFFKTLGRLFI